METKPNVQVQFMDTEDQDFIVLTSEEPECEYPISMETVNVEMEETAESSDRELYFCNSCNVAFYSVIDHIKIYHSEQEVVIEVDEKETTGKSCILTSEEAVENLTDEKDNDIPEDSIEKINSECIIVGTAITKGGNNQNIEIINLPEDEHCDDENSQLSSSKFVKIDQIFYTNTSNSQVKQKYNCDRCDLTFSSTRALCAHKKVHKYAKSSENKTDCKTAMENCALQLFKCEICSTSLISNKSLQLHKRMHDPSKPHIKPSIEPLTHLSVESKDAESQSIEKLINYYHCTVCDNWINDRFRDLHDTTHNDCQNFNCTKCNRKFTCQEDLEMHKNAHIPKKNAAISTDLGLMYPCNYCNRRFSRPYEKVKHERVHTGEKPYKCDICGKTFRVSYCKTLHMRTHTGERPYECVHCKKRFKSVSVYNFHILTHSEVRAYKCDLCPKTFKTPVQLAGHKNTHSKPFVCKECNRPFASLYAVRLHTLTHQRLNNLNFKCQLCGASYARGYALKDHLKEQHSVIEIEKDSDQETDLAAQSILSASE